jgi:hypothetical protein
MQVSYFGDWHRKSGTNGDLILCATFRSNFLHSIKNALSYAHKTTIGRVWHCRCDSIEASLCFWNSCSSFLTCCKSDPRVPHISHIASAACTVRRHVDRVVTFTDNSLQHKHTHRTSICPRYIRFDCRSLNSWLRWVVYGVFSVWKLSWSTLYEHVKASCGDRHLWSEPTIKRHVH